MTAPALCSSCSAEPVRACGLGIVCYTRAYRRAQALGCTLADLGVLREREPGRGCSVPGCTEPHKARGLCARHFAKLRHEQERARRLAERSDLARQEPARSHVVEVLLERGLDPTPALAGRLTIECVRRNPFYDPRHRPELDVAARDRMTRRIDRLIVGLELDPEAPGDGSFLEAWKAYGRRVATPQPVGSPA